MSNSNLPETNTFPALQDFKTKLEQCTVRPQPDEKTSWSGREFIQAERLKEWLNGHTLETTNGQSKRVPNIERLLDDAYRSHNRDSIVPNYQSVMKGPRTCCLVFCILLELDKGHLLHLVVPTGLIDSRLASLQCDEIAQKLERALSPYPAEERQASVRHLYDRQWAYKPHIFSLDSWSELSEREVLPMYQRQQINEKGATASLHQVAIPAEFIDQQLKQDLARSSFTIQDLGTCYHVAIKTFEHGNKAIFDHEVDAYQQLAEQQGIVKFLGAYTHRESIGKASHNILLEYGEMDLAEYFRCYDPPILLENVLSFWKNISRIAGAVAGLHKFKRMRRGQEEAYWGWHSDIKPDNIIRVRGEFKLADPGCAGWTRQNAAHVGPRARRIGMTMTYGAPECHLQAKETDDPHAADVWSLGCVLSEAATWLILGAPGLGQYTKLRMNATAQFSKGKAASAPKTQSASGNSHQLGGKVDCFHNGRDVLPQVRSWHNYLRKVMRPSDIITSQVLDLVEASLLKGKATDRDPAEQLEKKLGQILESNTKTTLNISEDVLVAVADVEKELESLPVTALLDKSLPIQDRKALTKSTSLLAPRQIAHITNMFKADLSPVMGQITSHPSPIMEDTVEAVCPERSGSSLAEGVDIRSDRSPVHSPINGKMRPLSSHRGHAQKTHQTQTVFDVHYEEDDGSMGTKINSLWSKKRDDLLHTHYRGQRDIVFVVDNAVSMREHWGAAKFLLEKLASKTANIDKDGVDLRFANHGESVQGRKNEKATSWWKRSKNEMKSNAYPRDDSATNMSEVLGNIVQPWFQQYEKTHTMPKKLTIIVLTDGLWTGMSDHAAMEKMLLQIDQNLKSISRIATLTTRPISIEFVSFGNDSEALYRLRYLDDGLKLDQDIADFVDTEHYTGDVYKMLLGSFVEVFDHQDEDHFEDDPGLPFISGDYTYRSEAGPSDQHRRERSLYSGASPRQSELNTPRALSRQPTAQALQEPPPQFNLTRASTHASRKHGWPR